MAEQRQDDDTSRAEFDSVAAWTAEAIARVAAADPIPAACNGSGSPEALGWLADRLDAGTGAKLLDTGAGLGGPAAWLRSRTGADTFTAEPMSAAVRAARRLFPTPGVVAWSDRLPFRGGSFDAAVALAVLSTVEDKTAFLEEVGRVLRPGGRLGVLDYVSTGKPITDPPAANEFVTADELDGLVASSGFVITDSAVPNDPGAAPSRWREVEDRVEAELERAHRGDEELDQARRQRKRFARLLGEGALAVRLLTAERTSA